MAALEALPPWALPPLLPALRPPPMQGALLWKLLRRSTLRKVALVPLMLTSPGLQQVRRRLMVLKLQHEASLLRALLLRRDQVRPPVLA